MMKSVLKKSLCFLAAAFFLLGSAKSAFANVLSNSGFEQEIGEGNWDNTNNAARKTVSDLFNEGKFIQQAGGYEGNYLLELADGAFTFQVKYGVKEGDTVVFSGWAQSDSHASGQVDEDPTKGGRLCIEYRDNRRPGGSAAELIRSDCTALINDGRTPMNWADSQLRNFDVRSVAPAGTTHVSFVIEFHSTPPDGDGARKMYVDNVAAEVNPAGLNIALSKSSAKPGEIVTMFMKFDNATGNNFNNTEIVSSLPPGFNLVESSVRVNDNSVQYKTGSIIIPIGTVATGASVTAAYQLVISNGVKVGKRYEIEVWVRDGTGALSEKRMVSILIESDPVFDQGTIIGKVYNDKNKNGEQDPGEKGIPGVRLATEEGVIIFTDENGMYHLEGVKEGRHIVKIDGHSLPDGTEFITEEAYLVKTTPGILNKANFAVAVPEENMPAEFGEDLTVMVTQGLDTSKPVLEVSVDQDVIRLGVGRLTHDPVFKFRNNYADFVKTWYLEVRDEMGREVWTGFGVSAPPQEVVWNGQQENGLLVKEGIYSYQLKIEDKDGRQDWSPLYFFRIIAASAPQSEDGRHVELPAIGDFNLFKDGKRSIPLTAKPTIRVQGKTKTENRVLVNDFPVSVDKFTGKFETEIYTTPGEKEINVVATSPEGESTTYQKKIAVKDSTFFMAGLTEGQAGLNFSKGDLETVGNDRSYKDELYTDGRTAFYLKGKIKGKFLIKSKFDSQKNDSTSFFTNLDPNDYYPVYGDDSTKEYDAESNQRFYLLVEMDRSFAQWGSFKTAFTDTELATYNRTLSGAKIHYETQSTTAYGDAKRGFTVFAAKSDDQQADHNEFASTGGMLYYLRNRNVIAGSEKVRVEVRDKIQDISISSRDLFEGQDYEINLTEGRIILNDLLPSYVNSSMNSNFETISGDKVFLVVDYEYQTSSSAYDATNRGIRGYTHIGQHLKVGATAIEEKRGGVDYDLRGVDATLKLGRNTKISAEYAESMPHLKQTEQSISYNGGLSFGDIGLLKGENSDDREFAYLVKGESKPVKNLELTGYAQAIQPGFSNAQMMTQEGQQKFGVSARYNFTDRLYTRYRYDHAELSKQLRPLTENNVAAAYNQKSNYSLQTVYDGEKWLAEAEYMRQQVDFPVDSNLVPTYLSEAPFENALAGKLGYHINDRLLPYLKVQTTIMHSNNNQAGGGFRYLMGNGLYAHLEQMFGNLGDSTQFGFEKQDKTGARNYANMKLWDMGYGVKSLSTTIGSSYSISPKSRIYSEKQHSTYNSSEGYSDIIGSQTRLNDNWDVEGKFERRHLKGSTFRLLDNTAAASLSRTNSFNTVSGALAYDNHKRFKARTSLEVRADQDTPKMWQWVSRNYVDYKVTRDLSFRSHLNYGKSHFRDPADTPADYVEFNTGFAYRPIDNDRLNILARYTNLRNLANDIQFNPAFAGVETDETAHIWATDIAYDVNKYFGIVEKLAYKTAVNEVNVVGKTIVNSLLWANRINFHVTRKWDVALEYRGLWQKDALSNLKHGPLVEIDRELYDYVRLGVGYNFTDFNDNLRTANNYQSHGPFVRMTGKF